jgi:hypothetical protein
MDFDLKTPDQHLMYVILFLNELVRRTWGESMKLNVADDLMEKASTHIRGGVTQAWAHHLSLGRDRYCYDVVAIN